MTKKNPKEKTNLCDWICEHATADDFRGFQQVFDIVEDVLAFAPAPLPQTIGSP